MTTKAESAQAPPEKRGGWVRNVVAIALAAVVVAAAALAPTAILHLEDTVLFETAQPRHQQGGDLSDGSYLAWVFLARVSSNETPRLSAQNNLEAYEVTNAMYTRLYTMAEAGIFQLDMPSALMDSIYQAGLEVQTENTLDNYGFEVLNLYSTGNGPLGIAINMVTEKRTGKVVQMYCYSNLPEHSWFFEELAYNGEQIMQQYLAWLGLGELENWELLSTDAYTSETDDWFLVSQYWGNAKLGLAVNLNVGADYLNFDLTAYNG
ncbi:MAG: hypothetical protein GXY32_00550 [Ruminococcaceae bacterium]|nr:hypothetical protein [Oscillospiraceae bacterium]